ncbi:hypothetical protein EMIT079MI2_90035 [Bacillus sp. IT-79MI2]
MNICSFRKEIVLEIKKSHKKATGRYNSPVTGMKKPQESIRPPVANLLIKENTERFSILH